MKEKFTEKEPKKCLDPFQTRIQEELEEFLQDLALEKPFLHIFEALRRWDFQDRFGPKVVPLPKRKALLETEDSAELKELQERVDHFLIGLEKDFGSNYSQFIRDSFRYYTQTTKD